MTDVESAQLLHIYRGNCHCGAFVFEVQLPEIRLVTQCNCSICHRKGYLWVFPKDRDDVKAVKGSVSKLTTYAFNDKKIFHRFCPTCATPIMAQASDIIALNAHALQNINTWVLRKELYVSYSHHTLKDISNTTSTDCANIGDPYLVPEHKGPLPPIDIEGGRLYTGGCHCGAVTIALISKPLDGTTDEAGLECNCSICERNGYIWTYPRSEQVVLHAKDPSNIGRYHASTIIVNKTFCKICGINLTNEYNKNITAEQRAKFSDEAKKWDGYSSQHHPVNLRTLSEVDLEKLDIRKNYALHNPPQYSNP